jgi:hypothetical protein
MTVNSALLNAAFKQLPFLIINVDSAVQCQKKELRSEKPVTRVTQKEKKPAYAHLVMGSVADAPSVGLFVFVNLLLKNLVVKSLFIMIIF